MISAVDQSGVASRDFVWRLTAIAFADLVDYSRMMQEDSIGTIRMWNELRENVLLSHMHRHDGRLAGAPGDAVLIEFPSVVRAVQWALDVQQAQRDKFDESQTADEDAVRLRIGINVDEVIDDEGILQSDGVNIAARIHQFADPGEIVLTAFARELIGNRLPISFRDLGTPFLKNIERPIRVYAVDRLANYSPMVQPYLGWTNRPTLAVLPFRTSSSHDEDKYFGEGITDDIITGVSRSKTFYVIARSSTLKFNHSTQNLNEIANALGVKYVLTGNVRRQSDKLRINTELVEAEHMRTLWTEKFDGGNEDLFDFQDGIVSNIVARIEPQMQKAETAKISSRPTSSLDAYDCVLRALWHLYQFTPDSYTTSRVLLERAVQLDQNYAHAYAYLAWCLNFWIGEGHSRDPETELLAAVEAARRAAEIDPEDALCLSIRGHIMSFIERNPKGAMEIYEQALSQNDNSTLAWGLSAMCCAYLGNGDEARERLRNVWRLSPYDPLNFFYWAAAGVSEFVAGRYEESVVWLAKSYRLKPRFVATLRMYTAALAMNNNIDEANAIGKELTAIEPEFSVSQFVNWYPLQQEEHSRALEAGLKRAGLPD